MYFEFEGKNKKTLLVNEFNSMCVAGPVSLLLIKVMIHIKQASFLVHSIAFPF